MRPLRVPGNEVSQFPCRPRMIKRPIVQLVVALKILTEHEIKNADTVMSESKQEKIRLVAVIESPKVSPWGIVRAELDAAVEECEGVGPIEFNHAAEQSAAFRCAFKRTTFMKCPLDLT